MSITGERSRCFEGDVLSAEMDDPGSGPVAPRAGSAVTNRGGKIGHSRSREQLPRSTGALIPLDRLKISLSAYDRFALLRQDKRGRPETLMGRIEHESLVSGGRRRIRRGIKTVAVTNGYINPVARKELYSTMDAANIDLKAFTERFYSKLTLSHLEPVLDTLRWLKHESQVWFEITYLVIPGENDSPLEVKRMCDWILENLGDEVPLHFTAFFPAYRMADRLLETLARARDQAWLAGLKYVYAGNVIDPEKESTYCSKCSRCVIERFASRVLSFKIDGGRCSFCGNGIPGVFEHFIDS